MQRIRHLIKIILTVCLFVLLTGCDSIDGFEREISDRMAMNHAYVDTLESAGIISNELAVRLKETIEKNAQELQKWLDNASVDKIQPYVSRVEGIGQIKAHNGTMLTKEEEELIEAYPLLSDDDQAVKELLDILDFNVYVLRKDVRGAGTGENSIVTMDTVVRAVEQARQITSSDKMKGKVASVALDKYFIKTSYKVWDTSKDANKIIKETKPYSRDIITGCPCSKDGVAPLSSINRNQTHLVLVGTDTHECSVCDSDNCRDLERAVEFKLKEFNADAINRLCGGDGVNKDKFVIIGTNCYLMEYPAYYVEGFDTEDNSTFHAIYKQSDYIVNILTNKLFYKDGRECVGDILSVTGDTNVKYSDTGSASFITDGLMGTPPIDGFLRPNADGTIISPDAVNEMVADLQFIESEALRGRIEQQKSYTTQTQPTSQNQSTKPKAGTIVKDIPDEIVEEHKKYGRVVLRDYLELSYMPTVVDNEDLIAIGRRLRLTKFAGTGKEPIGIFITKDGEIFPESAEIRVTDLMDIANGFDKKQKHKLNITGDNQQNTTTNTTGNTTPDNTIDTSGVQQGNRSLLDTVLTNKITVATRFPGDIVDRIDTIDRNNSTQQQSQQAQSQTQQSQTQQSQTQQSQGALQAMSAKVATAIINDPNATQSQINSAQAFIQSGVQAPIKSVKTFLYGMGVDIDPFISNLYSGWIKADSDSTNGSLDWWNEWLKATGYNYRVDKDALLAFLNESYAFGIDDDSTIILDMHTLRNIQKDLDSYKSGKETSVISTIFVIIALFLLAYSALLMLAWVYDTNIIAGVRLMSLMTFGRMEAIAGKDELPTLKKDSKKYMTFQDTTKASFKILVLALLLLFVDVMSLITLLVSLFGQIAVMFSQVMKAF